MSNNIKDYLSVEKISVRELQQPVLVNKMRMLKSYNQSNLITSSNPEYEGRDLKEAINMYNSQVIQGIIPQQVPRKRPDNILLRKQGKFKPPFQLYYYRDFMWKIGYSNGFVVQTI